MSIVELQTNIDYECYRKLCNEKNKKKILLKETIKKYLKIYKFMFILYFMTIILIFVL